MMNRAFGCFFMLAICAILGAILVPNFVRARSRGSLTACKSNLKNIGTALEMYSTDWSGLYPASMSQLTPNYLKTIPECPNAGRDTYSESYHMKREPIKIWSCATHGGSDSLLSPACSQHLATLNDHLKTGRLENLVPKPEFACPDDGTKYEYHAYWEVYEICCLGSNHTHVSVPPDYPKYDGIQGLIER